ncbi:hypothetical protein HYS00_00725 [Candidatus Microgenomates bacterium]|nr:hypothetical protein [Candidatus Microgenomates bacterium]
MEPTTSRLLDKRLLLGVGITAALLAVLSVILVAQRTKIPEPGHTFHSNETLVTPTLQPTLPVTLDTKIKSLSDDAAAIDQSIKEFAAPTP